ncbi:hypothetical protein [Brucella sp. 22210]|uniref:hypothetical protein n=1 Tax=Brucella sp. 22210 TaxID=3453892 RepID=UPI003F831BCC
MHEYEVGHYIREEFFNDLSNEENGILLVYCDKAATKNNTKKYTGVWNLYVYSDDTKRWHPLVKSKLVRKQIVKREFLTSDGLINSILRFSFPVLGIPKEQGSGCEINKDGTIYYRPQCIFNK